MSDGCSSLSTHHMDTEDWYGPWMRPSGFRKERTIRILGYIHNFIRHAI